MTLFTRSHTQDPASATGTRPHSALFSGGVQGNARLTAMTGLTLLVLLFFEGLTIPALRLLLLPHIFIGFLLVPPLALKLGSTGYRFLRYYTGNESYRVAGPPKPLLRLLAPFLIVSILILIGSGIVLLIVGPGDGPWRRIHILAFLGWFWLMSIHVLAYTLRAIRLTWLDFLASGREAVAGAVTRRSLLTASILLGCAVALAALPLDSAWVHALNGLGVGH